MESLVIDNKLYKKKNEPKSPKKFQCGSRRSRIERENTEKLKMCSPHFSQIIGDKLLHALLMKLTRERWIDMNGDSRNKKSHD